MHFLRDIDHRGQNAYLWVRPAPNTFTVLKGDENTTLATHEFGSKNLGHKVRRSSRSRRTSNSSLRAPQFCPTCGTSLLGRFRQETHGMTVLINVRPFAA